MENIDLDQVLNPVLVQRLTALYGEVKVVNAGEPAVYLVVRPKFQKLFKNEVTLQLTNWGETYAVCCLDCGDTRFRLFFSHAYNANIEVSAKQTINAGKCWFRCHNEHCKLHKLGRIAALEGIQMEGATLLRPPLKGKAVKKAEIVEMPLPEPNIPINVDTIPAAVKEYIANRGFSPADLWDQHSVRWLPTGVTLWTTADGTEVKTWEDRLLIPLVARGVMIGWQARVCRTVPKEDKETRKYLFPPGLPKTAMLYGMDDAKFCLRPTLAEGAPDVWKLGKGAIGMLGSDKQLPDQQLKLMKRLWTWRAQCVVMLDADAYESKAVALAAWLREKEVCGGRVYAFPLLPEEDDPGSMTAQQADRLNKRAHLLLAVLPDVMPTLSAPDIRNLADAVDGILTEQYGEGWSQRGDSLFLEGQVKWLKQCLLD